jgi:hypothetical protein
MVARHSMAQREYKRVLDHRLLRGTLIEFRRRFDHDNKFTEEKIVDTLIWRFVSLLRSRDIDNPEINYS